MYKKISALKDLAETKIKAKKINNDIVMLETDGAIGYKHPNPPDCDLLSTRGCNVYLRILAPNALLACNAITI